MSSLQQEGRHPVVIFIQFNVHTIFDQKKFEKDSGINEIKS
jgi:hypothetical protein